jgi:hypothetical protein
MDQVTDSFLRLWFRGLELYIFKEESRKVYWQYLKTDWHRQGSPFCAFMVSVTYILFVNVLESGNNSEQLEIEAYTHKYFDVLEFHATNKTGSLSNDWIY